MAADALMAALKASGLPVADVQSFTADTDPNKLLGRPNQYTGKVSWNDAAATSDQFGNSTIELFSDQASLEARQKYVDAISKSGAAFAQYIYANNVIRGLLRLPHDLTPTQAQSYEAWFEKLPALTTVSALSSAATAAKPLTATSPAPSASALGAVVPNAPLASAAPDSPTAAPQPSAPSKPITFDKTDFRGGFRADHFQIAVTLTNHDATAHNVTAQANFYDTDPGHLGDDPAAHLATAGYSTLTLKPHESATVLIAASDIGGPTIVSVGFTATCKDGATSEYCAAEYPPTTGH